MSTAQNFALVVARVLIERRLRLAMIPNTGGNWPPESYRYASTHDYYLQV